MVSTTRVMATGLPISLHAEIALCTQSSGLPCLLCFQVQRSRDVSSLRMQLTPGQPWTAGWRQHFNLPCTTHILILAMSM